MRLASHLTMPIQQCQAAHTSSEFEEWLTYLEQEQLTNIRKDEFYLAALTAEVRRSWVSDESRLNIKNTDFIIDLTGTLNHGTVEKSQAQKEKEKQDYLDRSKNHWLSFAKVEEK